MVSAVEGKASGTINILGMEITGKASGYAGATGVKGKYGKGTFYGFETVDEKIVDGFLKEDLVTDFDELLENEMIIFIDGDIHISALGQHIFGMMLEPEQYMMLSNEADHLRIKKYILPLCNRG